MPANLHSPPIDLRWRPLDADDHPAVVEVDAAIDAAEHLSDPMTAQTAAAFLGPPWVDPERDTIGVFDGTGRLLGYSVAMASATDHGNRVLAFFEARPESVGLEPELLAWSIARGHAQIAAGTPGVESVIRVSVDDHRTRRRDVLAAGGLAPVRTFAEMARDLDDVPPVPAPPGDVAVVPWAPELDDSARLASNAAFAGHWGSLPMTSDQWRGLYRDNPGFRGDLSFLATANGEVVGMCLVETDAERDARVGFTEAWIHRLGTIPRRQREGIAGALMVTTMRAIRDAGIVRTALGVDEHGEAGALALYRRLGFAVELRTVEYVAVVTGSEPGE